MVTDSGPEADRARAVAERVVALIEACHPDCAHLVWERLAEAYCPRCHRRRLRYRERCYCTCED